MKTADIHKLLSEASQTITVEPNGFFGKNVKRFTAPTPTGECRPTIQGGFAGLSTERLTHLQFSTNSPPICLHDIEHPYQVSETIEVSRQHLIDTAKFVVEQELMRFYSKNCRMQLSYTEKLDKVTDAVPTMPVDWELLGFLYSEHKIAAGLDGAAGVDPDGHPVYHMACGFYECDLLKTLDMQNRDEAKADKASDKLHGGRGFVFNTLRFDPRWASVMGKWIQRHPWKVEDGLAQIDTDYKTAQFTDIFMFLNNVIEVSEGIDQWTMTWVPTLDDSGDLTDMGHWRISCNYTPRVNRGDLGAVIRVKRCLPAYGMIDCDRQAFAHWEA